MQGLCIGFRAEAVRGLRLGKVGDACFEEPPTETLPPLLAAASEAMEPDSENLAFYSRVEVRRFKQQYQ